MTDAMTAALKEAYASVPTNVVVLDTLEIYHPSIVGHIYLVRNLEPLTLTLEDTTTHEFEAANFDLRLPKKSDEGVQDLELKICNVDRRVSDFMDNAANFQSKVVCLYRPYLSNDLTQPQMVPALMLTLSDVQATVYEVTARASFADLVNRKFPNQIYSRATFPGLIS